MADKITERDIYNSMIAGTIDAGTLKTFAEKKIAQLDKRNASAKVRAAKKRAEGDALLKSVFSFVGNEAQSRVQITDAMVAAGHDVTVGKVGARLNSLVADGHIAKEKGKITGADGKSKTVTFYSLAQ